MLLEADLEYLIFHAPTSIPGAPKMPKLLLHESDSSALIGFYVASYWSS